MNIHQSDFVGSYPSYRACPSGDLPEFAFIGRSNVGKSSLINMLCTRKELAHTSKKPGKTQLLNYYLVNKEWHLVDLPGYGYASVSKTQRKSWEKMIQDYLRLRENLVCAFVLIDANVPPQKIDIEFINRLGEMAVPFVLVYTKTDRLKPQEVEENIAQIRTALLEYWTELPDQFITSAAKQVGREELLSYIDGLRREVE